HRGQVGASTTPLESPHRARRGTVHADGPAAKCPVPVRQLDAADGEAPVTGQAVIGGGAEELESTVLTQIRLHGFTRLSSRTTSDQEALRETLRNHQQVRSALGDPRVVVHPSAHTR